MKTRLALALVPWLLLIGCRGVGAVDLLEHQLRHREYEVDELNIMLEQCHNELESAYLEIDRLEQEGSQARSEPRLRSEPAPRRRPAATIEEQLPDAAPPVIEGLESEPADRQSSARRRTSVRPAAYERRLAGRPAPPPSRPTERRIVDRRVAQLVASARRASLRPGQRSAHDGIVVLVEPRNAAGQPLRVPGELTIEVVDPAARGDRARVAAWKFSATDAARHYSASGPGLRFELPWSGAPPVSDDLRLYVRFLTASGRVFTARGAVRLESLAAAGHPRPAEMPERSAASLRGPALRAPLGQREALRNPSWREPGERWSPVVDRPVPLAPPPDDEPAEAPEPDRTARTDRPEWTPYR